MYARRAFGHGESPCPSERAGRLDGATFDPTRAHNIVTLPEAKPQPRRWHDPTVARAPDPPPPQLRPAPTLTLPAHSDAYQWHPPVEQPTVSFVLDNPAWTRSAEDGGAVLVRTFIGPRNQVVYRYALPVTGELVDLYRPLEPNAI